MFGMYTEKARRALELAAEESRDPDLGSGGWLLPEHLVLALLGMPEDAVGPRVLAGLGVTREAFLSLLQGWGHPFGGFREGKRRRPRINPETHLILEDSLQLALDLGCGYVGSEHLLLGVLYEGRYEPGRGPAERALVELGTTYEAVRELVENEAGEETAVEGSESPLSFAVVPVVRKTRSAARIFEYARQQAQQDRSYRGRVGTHHYLLACMMDLEGDTLACRVLESFGLSYAVLKARAEELYDLADASDVPGPMPPPPPYPEVIEAPPEGAIPEEELGELRRINRFLEEQEEDL